MGKEMCKNPLISILVTCFNRREFIIEAVKSILNQTLKRELYEIIVSKNFKDAEIDTFLSKNGCKVLYDERGGIGLRLTGMIIESQADILVFMEDDDKFEIEKLEHVLKIFSSTEVVYFHNDYKIVDSENHIISENSIDNMKSEQIFTLPITSFNTVKKLYQKKAFFSMSNISIRKAVLLKYISNLSKIKLIPDFYIFLIALQNNGLIAVSQFQLTVWMFHSSTSVSNGSKTSFINKRKQFWLKVTSDLEQCLTIVSTNYLRTLVECVYSEALTHDFLLGVPNISRSTLIYLVSRELALFRDKRSFLVFLAALAGIIAQKNSLIIYSNFLLRKSPKS